MKLVKKCDRDVYVSERRVINSVNEFLKTIVIGYYGKPVITFTQESTELPRRTLCKFVVNVNHTSITKISSFITEYNSIRNRLNDEFIVETNRKECFYNETCMGIDVTFKIKFNLLLDGEYCLDLHS
jgi:hypothetical protein